LIDAGITISVDIKLNAFRISSQHPPAQEHPVAYLYCYQTAVKEFHLPFFSVEGRETK